MSWWGSSVRLTRWPAVECVHSITIIHTVGKRREELEQQESVKRIRTACVTLNVKAIPVGDLRNPPRAVEPMRKGCRFDVRTTSPNASIRLGFDWLSPPADCSLRTTQTKRPWPEEILHAAVQQRVSFSRRIDGASSSSFFWRR